MPDLRYFDEHGNYLDGPHYGKDCPQGKVQVEFVSAVGAKQFAPNSWTPGDYASLELWVDGRRYRVEVGTFHDGKAERRGLHIVGPAGMRAERTAINAASVWLDN